MEDLDMTKCFLKTGLVLSLLISVMKVDYSHAEAPTPTENVSKNFKITANLKGTVTYQKGATQTQVPAILSFGKPNTVMGPNSLIITNFEENASVPIENLRKITQNVGGYKLTDDKGEPMKYADAVAKKIPGVTDGGGYAIVQGLRIQVTCTTKEADGRNIALFTNWIGVEKLKELIIVNPDKNGSPVKVIYEAH